MEQELPKQNSETKANPTPEQGVELVKQSDGLIERIEKEYVTRDGRKLLTERIR